MKHDDDDEAVPISNARRIAGRDDVDSDTETDRNFKFKRVCGELVASSYRENLKDF
jgi:hypothetical protein